ncbi:MAG TPA: hypothetical protein DHU59_00765, partial [Clostridiales bacterium]|nr:hypothetical protein [Clostridiales bacterium]
NKMINIKIAFFIAYLLNCIYYIISEPSAAQARLHCRGDGMIYVLYHAVYHNNMRIQFILLNFE